MSGTIRNRRIIALKGGASSSGTTVASIVAGRNITVDNTDPANPIVATTADDIIVVANYAALPAPGTVSNNPFYWVSNSSGTAWLPGALGGTYYSAGLYYSNGVSWEFLSVPYQATQAEVDTGTNTDKFITPATLRGTVILGVNGGTGVSNSGKTITLSGNLATTGAFNTTFATGFTGTLTLPTATSTLATLALSEAFTNKSYNGLTLTSTTGTFTLTNAKTFSVTNTITLSGTDSSTLNIGAGGTLGSNAYTSTAYAPIASPTFTGTVTIPTPFTLGAVSVTSTGTQLNYLSAATGTTGTTSTNLVFSTSPTITTPTIIQTLTINGDVSAASWTTSGIGIIQSAATYTDTSTAGTRAYVTINSQGVASVNSTNAVTINQLIGTLFQTPKKTAGGNVTISTDAGGFPKAFPLAVSDGTNYMALGFSSGNAQLWQSSGQNQFRFTGGAATLALYLTDSNGSGYSSIFASVGASGGIYLQAGSPFAAGTKSSPTAGWHLSAGAATAGMSPLKFTSGTNLTVAEAGAAEYNGTSLFFTNGGAQRQELPQIQQSRVSTQFDATTNTTLANITGLTATLVAGKNYIFEAYLAVTADVVGGYKVDMTGGTATATTVFFDVTVEATGVSPTLGRQTALNTAVSGTLGTTVVIYINGLITVNGAGTLIPRFSQSASNGTSSVLVGSTFITQQIL